MTHKEFDEWFFREAHRAKYSRDHPAYLSAWEAWQAARQEAEPVKPDLDPWVLFDPKTKEIKMDPSSGALAVFEEEHHVKVMQRRHPGTEYKQAAWYRAPQPAKTADPWVYDRPPAVGQKVIAHWASGVAEMRYTQSTNAKTAHGRKPRYEWQGRVSPWEIICWQPMPEAPQPGEDD